MVQKKLTWKHAVLIAAAALLVAIVTAAPPALAKDFSGERITIVVPFGPGGGTDVYARFLAPHLQKHLPGNPTFLIRNIPGAGSIAGANQFQMRAKPDGLTVLGVSTSTITNYTLGDRRVRYKLHTFQPIILSPLGAVVYVAGNLGVQDVEGLAAKVNKLKKAKLIYGGQSPTSGDIRAVLSLHLLGVKPKPVWGMNGRGPARLGFERGEFNVNYDTASAYQKNVKHMLESGKAVPLFTLGFLDAEGNLVRDPTFPDIPHFNELYEAVHGEKLTGPAYDAWLTLFTIGSMTSKSLHLPAETPKDIVDTYRKAAAAMLEDPEFKKASAKVLGTYPQSLGENAKRVLQSAAQLSPEGRVYLQKWLKDEFDAKI